MNTVMIGLVGSMRNRSGKQGYNTIEWKMELEGHMCSLEEGDLAISDPELWAVGSHSAVEVDAAIEL